jgi:hypothetical protein
MQGNRWDKGGTVVADDYTLFYGKNNANHHLGTALLYTREQDQQLKE